MLRLLQGADLNTLSRELDVTERFFRTLKDQFLWLHDRRTLEELNEQLEQWRQLCNEQWLIQRHGHRSRAEVRRAHQPGMAA
ncbi:hypothetical protein [Thiohalorhabdus methylotrophus]|uniref:Transposase n=1 Tax=Thiohalorhabdus methylotrophus TaxID=3242694 RepID=A0ABV4TWB7_9GAMM